jgi:hypothetical protein
MSIEQKLASLNDIPLNKWDIKIIAASANSLSRVQSCIVQYKGRRYYGWRNTDDTWDVENCV